MPIQIYLNIAADMSRFLVEVSRKHPLKEQLENAVRSAGYEKTNVFFYDTDKITSTDTSRSIGMKEIVLMSFFLLIGLIDNLVK